MLNMNDIINGDPDDPSTQFEGVGDGPPTPPPPDEDDQHSPDHMEETVQTELFGSLSTADVNMTDQSSTPHPLDNNIDRVCSHFQSQLNLEPEYLKIASIASKCPPEDRYIGNLFANGAYHQLDVRNINRSQVTHAYDKCFRSFVRTNARMFLLKPTLEAYSNNPHNNGSLPKTLFYLTLDVVEKQPDQWKKDHLCPAQLKNDPDALCLYCDAVGELLKYQRSNLRTLLLHNILKTKKIHVDGAVPARKVMIAAVSDFQSILGFLVATNSAMRARMCYAQLVMVHYYAHKSNKDSQWAEIDERLAVLRGSSYDFQLQHAVLVLNKDFSLFSQGKEYTDISKEDFTVPDLEDVRRSIKSGIVPVTLR
ncbi:uncharacterized protein PGTG_16981 [Puccinia graminis f. sp. tritici CRL 75-36-700-3]|uniref:Uncharacterized protein n=1 Tax=Puccinia graminis f. sp. tritici (strain CRL 75-36-700-3 / race SCCL) TaxID=418459 RepID=E3L452_PUCGT|nr:uncharacterized protein PGTG_16981 [Puccinia graminis f. sp. tritici CRL 75-36-700-3]EFP91327.2 hypothetical protein PGTG_16981 [Puccinia graminis f. sp. tritici CRL 75-36-700-3]